MYIYQNRREHIFTDEGMKMLLKIRDMKDKLLSQSGACTTGKLLCVSGDSWDMMACVDYLVELGEINIINRGESWQNNIVVKAE